MAKPNYRQINGPNHADGGGNAKADCGSPSLPEHLEPRRYFSQTVFHGRILPKLIREAKIPMNAKTAALAMPQVFASLVSLIRAVIRPVVFLS
ncbi:hypothetical protein EN932_01615 [Mesorhizobium sp. M7A.F.Ca.US.002.01.1.1]|uniref:hypothetical protein n=1 Tax=Mesorhizobium sp. M7A.F.Ca.US.002.01.1.1 TaxID=2496700 RepID=UPI000FD35B70|nr:hypothetical protein [Mesorhizobium sp. M7A.F.Ca.US.002.01.1.1]RVA15322.1 hypothetical protein EN932_01615 [Mesorhizobium sp. M7A.F.Ca.US.002.01.1.1]